MSVRTHAPDCAKAQHHPSADCTCGATCRPGVASSDEFEHACRKAARLEQERDQARSAAELLRDNWGSRHVFRWER